MDAQTEKDVDAQAGKAADPQAKKAVLTYTKKAETEKFTLLAVQTETGRFHQIRAQLAAMGCHIKGDLKYGAPRSNPDGSISLHARSVNFMHPVKRIPVEVVAPVDWVQLRSESTDKVSAAEE